jgi:hypothetical protein
MDLLPNRFEIPVPKIERYLNPHIPAVLSYLDRWQPAYYITAINMLEETRDNGTHFSSLAYDRWGGVPLVDEGFHRDHRRFNAPAFTRLDHDQLNALQRMISQSHVQHFVVILTPYRQGVIQDSTKRTKLDSSIATLRETVEEAGGVFIDTTTVPWPDSLYHDSSHMRQSGAYKLTQFALKALDETTNPSSRESMVLCNHCSGSSASIHHSPPDKCATIDLSYVSRPSARFWWERRLHYLE